jgi:hypothetical protein
MINTERIEPLAQSLAADGYELKVAGNGPRVAVTVVAGPDACEDCLVPKDLMRGILANALGADGDSIDITYPKEVSS